MTVDELIRALLELTEHDPTVGGWVVMSGSSVISTAERSEQRQVQRSAKDTGLCRPVVRLGR